MKLTTQEIEDLRAHLNAEGNYDNRAIAKFLGIDARKTTLLDAIQAQLEPDVVVEKPQTTVTLIENGIAVPLNVVTQKGSAIYVKR